MFSEDSSGLKMILIMILIMWVIGQATLSFLNALE